MQLFFLVLISYIEVTKSFSLFCYYVLIRKWGEKTQLISLDVSDQCHSHCVSLCVTVHCRWLKGLMYI